MLWTTIKLYKINNDAKYLIQVAQMLVRYARNDPAKQKMCDKLNRVWFDGISLTMNGNKIRVPNLSIEVLWAFQLAEKYPDVLVEVKKYK